MGLLLLAFFLVSCGAGYWMVSHDRGPREPIRGIAMAMAMGLIGALLAATIENFVIPGIGEGGISLPVAAEIGIIEELCKFAPLALLLFTKSYFNEATDGLIYFGICGLAFGWLENVSYALDYGSATGIERLILIPFFHAATAGLVGYALARYKLKIDGKRAVATALGSIMLAHAAYDYLISSDNVQFLLSGALIAIALNVAFLNAYQRAAQIDRGLGLRREPVQQQPLSRELTHWNWGAFLLTWVWAIAHDSWIGLLTLGLPLLALFLAPIHSLVAVSLGRVCLGVSLLISIYLGARGNGVAWRNRHFSSEE